MGDKTDLFREEYEKAWEVANTLFPDESHTDIREDYLSKKRDQLFIKYGFLIRKYPLLRFTVKISINQANLRILLQLAISLTLVLRTWKHFLIE